MPASREDDLDAVSGPRSFAGQRLWLIAAFFLHAAVIAAFSAPYLSHANVEIPDFPFAPDEKLIVWILSWVRHALAAGVPVYDANIYAPAPNQLTGSEHLFALQTLFAPLYLLTQQEVLSTALVAFLTYPLAAVAMSALLVRVGCSRLIAWTCGLAYAVGLLRVPLNFHVLQYPNFLLPLLAIGIVQARDSPTVWRGLGFFLITLTTLLTSYYIAVIGALAGICWAIAELRTRRRSTLKFLAVIGVASILAAGVAANALYPYVARSEVMSARPSLHGGIDVLPIAARFANEFFARNGWPVMVLFAALAVLGFSRAGDERWRRIALPGALIFVLGTALTVSGLPGWLSTVIAYSPLRNFRAWARLLLLTDFGLYLLTAAGLSACLRRFGLAITAFPLTVLVLVTLPRLAALAEWPTFTAHVAADRKTPYERLVLFRGLGEGPVLELPSTPIEDSEAMLGSVVHWRPLVNGFSGYGAAHTEALRAAIHGLPARSALQEIIDLTHLSWIFLRPAQDWPTLAQFLRMRDKLQKTGLIGQVFKFDGFILLGVSGAPQHKGWRDAIAAGLQPGITALGTPLRRLSVEESIASIEQIRPLRAGARPNTLLLVAKISNLGAADWPVLGSLPRGQLDPRRPLVPYEVYLETTWTRLDPEGGPETVARTDVHQLNRDIPAGESIVDTLSLWTPQTSGYYRLDLRVRQKNGIDFYEPPSRLLHEIFEISEIVEEEPEAEETPAPDDLLGLDGKDEEEAPLPDASMWQDAEPPDDPTRDEAVR